MIQQIRALKNMVVKPGLHPRTVLSGPLKGLRYGLDLRHETQLYLGLYEQETHKSLERLVSGVRVVADVGAAFGYYTIYFMKKTAAEKVVAFEPSETQAARLLENVKLNGLAGDRRLDVSHDFVGRVVTEGTVTLDSYFAEETRPMLIKLDIEGAELDVLKGAEMLMKRATCKWFIETHSAQLEAECADFFRKRGFKTEIIENAWWRNLLPEVRPLDHNRWLVAV